MRTDCEFAACRSDTTSNARYRKRYARVSGSATRQSIRVSKTIASMHSALFSRTRWTSLRKNDYQSFSTRSPSSGSQEKRPFSNGLFSIQSEGLACNLTVGEYVIAEGVWHHASACILLRIDYIQHFVLIPYRRPAADFIHACRRDFTSCIFVL